MIDRRYVMKFKFLHSNKAFKEGYRVYLQFGYILSISLMLLVFKMNFTASDNSDTLVIEQQEEIFLEEVVQTKQEIKAPPPPRPSVPVEVPNDEILIDEIIDIDAELDLDAPMDIPPPPRPVQDDEDMEDEIFVVVEQQPELIGGIAAVQKNVVYPQLALQAGIEGRVIVQFVIDREGNVLNPEVIRGIGGGCDEEALRAIKLAKFKPGMQRGRPVSVRYTIPVTFRLKSVNS